MRNFFNLWVASILLWQPVFAQSLTDRLLFEVDLNSYSQTQMELYLLCKDILGGQVTLRSVNAQAWDKLLEEYKNDMVIHQEAVRLGSFEASARVLEKALDVFQDERSKNETLRGTLDRLGADDQAIRRNVGIAVRIEGFRRSKKRQAAVQTNRVESSLIQQNSVPEWHRDLIRRSVVRFYEGAIVFKPVSVNL